MVFQPEIVLFWDTRKSVKIKRPLRIKAAAKVYEPEWEVYFEHRQQEKMVGKFVGRNLLSYLYRRQAGKCAHCHPAITTETGWDRHHRHPKPRGGKDSDDNLLLLHPNCHEPVHHEGRLLERPPPRCRSARKERGQVVQTFEPYEAGVSRTVFKG